MGRNKRPVNAIDFFDDLPAYYSRYSGSDAAFERFVMQFEKAFEELQSEIVGDPLRLTFTGPGKHEDDAAHAGYPLAVEMFDTGRLEYPKGALVQAPGSSDTTLLAEAIPAGSVGRNLICVTSRNFFNGKLLDGKLLKPGDRFIVSTGSGVTGLSSIRETPPANFKHLSAAVMKDIDKLAYLQYLASWVGLPLRSDKLMNWNRRYLRNAVKLLGVRSTLPGLTKMLNEWHQEEVVAAETVVTDLISSENGVDTVFRIGQSRIGIETMLGEGAQNQFQVHLTADPTDVCMRDPINMIAMENAARLILDLEKPAHTDYELHIHARTMQLAPDAPIAPYKRTADKRDEEDIPEGELAVKDTNTFARIGVTTLLWND